MKYMYPAIFSEDGDWLMAKFPDFDCATCGKGIKQAVEYAEDLLNGTLLEMERAGETIPPPTPLDQVHPDKNQLVRLIHADTDAYAVIDAQIQQNPIRYARERAGMTVAELARHLGAPYRTVQDWNSGLKRPPKWCENLIFKEIMQFAE